MGFCVVLICIVCERAVYCKEKKKKKRDMRNFGDNQLIIVGVVCGCLLCARGNVRVCKKRKQKHCVCV